MLEINLKPGDVQEQGRTVCPTESIDDFCSAWVILTENMGYTESELNFQKSKIHKKL